jgi:hypothetical protein
MGLIAERFSPKFDRISNRQYNNAIVTTRDVAVQSLRALLAQKQLSSGGWAALSPSSQTALEPTALACIALGRAFTSVHNRATAFLSGIQNPNGSWPVFPGDDQEGAWVTALVLIALHDKFKAIPERLKGFSWVPHTNSWVVPTAFSILALNQRPCACGLDAGPSRVALGIAMLLDRACPGGGWNAGNGVVYGVALAPHPDDTAIALLALSGQRQQPVVRTSVDWLERVAPTLSAPWSLAWSILALAAHGCPVEFLVQSLSSFSDPDQIEDNSTLAAACLALDYQCSLAAFGVTA